MKESHQFSMVIAAAYYYAQCRRSTREFHGFNIWSYEGLRKDQARARAILELVLARYRVARREAIRENRRPTTFE